MNRRAALVVSNDLFSGHAAFCIVCPITNTRRDYPFHVSIPAGRDATLVLQRTPHLGQPQGTAPTLRTSHLLP
jgi:mRNA-degrading endonuclease toxin of MazEF toxin-antitoxin module